MTINLKTAIHTTQTYQELLSIARELRAGLSSWGYQYAVVKSPSSMYEGTVAINAVAEKAMKIRQSMEKHGVRFTPEEKKSLRLLSIEISCLYEEDTVNCKGADTCTTLCRWMRSLIFWVNHPSKWKNGKNGLSYSKQLQQPLSISLKTAVNKAQTYQELLSIAHELYAGLSWWGYQYVHAPNPPSADGEVIYTGRIAIGDIAEKALKIRREMEKNKREFTTNEIDSVLLFCKKVHCLYAEDQSLCDQANCLTALFRSVVRIVFWADHQSRWGDIRSTIKMIKGRAVHRFAS
ncbi:MAG: hypothetical protein LBC45_03930 [Chlamydiales bacterium]|jgi:hypothetical protein|nr:hypothetical protein [Chlamydiales bacterium]